MPERLSEVEAKSWDDFENWFKGEWRQGQHIALIGPTGTGKTTLACRLLQTRRHVLALDPKGGDTTLATLEKRGFRRLTTWPPERRERDRIERNEQNCHYIVGYRRPQRAEMGRHRDLLRRTIDDVFDEGGWTTYVDELQMAAGEVRHGGMALGGGIERLLIAARDRGVSVVTAYQRPANVPRSASEMSSWIVVYNTRDREVVKRLAEIMGRPGAEIEGIMRALPKHFVMVVGEDVYEPIILTKAPKAA
jgi:energy-coupling factor transporter ATP-binding protein EcfA2